MKLRICRGLLALLLLLTSLSISGSAICFQNPDQLDNFFGIANGTISTPETDINTQYYKSMFGDGTFSADNLQKLIEATYEQNVQEMCEGAVLLKNSNHSLPLSESERNVALFGKQLEQAVNSGAGEPYAVSLSEALQNAGFSIDGGSTAIYMISRSSGEGSEFAMINDAGISSLALQHDEKEELSRIKQKGYTKLIVLLNTTNPIEMDWADSADYGVDAVLWIGGPGWKGFDGVAKLLTGEVNPSGHLTDTYASCSASAPACVNGSANSPRWLNYETVFEKLSENKSSVSYHSIQAESIYIGYRYYETRYEDCVLGRFGADSAVGSTDGTPWQYEKEVTYPFGYGLSYTTFSMTMDSVSESEDGSLIVTVTVENTGSRPGKQVVQVYAQTPYGDYERENLVEKSAIQLVGYGKTNTLNPGESQSIPVTVRKYFLASYDYTNAKGYILSEGDYYLAIGTDCHDALNNILAAKGCKKTIDPNGNPVNGDETLTYHWIQDQIDTETFRYTATGADVTNQFDDCDINTWIPNTVTYLSRQDWEGTYPIRQTAVEITDEMIQILGGELYQASDDAPPFTSFQQGAKNGITAFQMRGVPYHDDEKWNAFLSELTIEEMAQLLPDLRVKDPIESIVLPSYRSNNGPDAVSYTFPAEQYGEELSRKCCRYCDQSVLASTWNLETQKNRGSMMGEELLFCGLYQVYGPGANLHRTPFGGRNCEYWSEDPNLTYIGTSAYVQGVMEKGVNCQIKHLAGNDQEFNRQGISLFFTEQAWREGALRAFEGALTEGGGLGCMNGLNRIGLTWTNASKALCTNVLRKEWGFRGTIDTDGIASSYQKHFITTLTAGTGSYDLDSTGASSKAVAEYLKETQDGYVLQCLRDAAKHKLYPIVNSAVMNGLTEQSAVSKSISFWKYMIIAIISILIVADGLLFFCLNTHAKKNKI